MDSLILNSLAERALDDLTARYFHFKELGNEYLAELMAEEGLELALALDQNHTFFCLPILEDFSTDAPLF